MLTQNARPKFNADTHYIPLADGVYLRENSNRLILTGKSLYPLLEHLVPNLNGNVTLAELTRGLDGKKQRMIVNLLEKLAAHHFLQDMSQDQAHTLRPLELETYQPDVTFISSFQTSAASRLASLRNRRLLLLGCGSGLAALVQASLQCGVKQVDIMITSGDECGENCRSGVSERWETYDPEQAVSVRESPDWADETEVLHAIQTYDAILSFAEQPMLARAQLLNRLCIEQQKTFMQAIVVDDHAWIGPLVSPETGACWECAWRRLQATLTDAPEAFAHYQFYDLPQVAGSRFLTLPQATMIAQRLLFPLFQHFTDTDRAEAGKYLSVIELATYLSENHAILPHPHCLACQHPTAQTASQFLEQIQRLRQAPGDPDNFLNSFAACVDAKLGLFTAFENAHFVQAPLAVYQVTLSNPMFRKSQDAALRVVAASTEPAGARLQVAQKACERYAANLLACRRLLPAEMVAHQTSPTAQWSGQTLPSDVKMWTWALDLHQQQVCLVPAEQVFPILQKQERAMLTRERGIASGMIWEEAICQAIFDWCNYLTVEHLQEAQQAYPQIDLATMPMSPEALHLHRLLTSAGAQITIYDVTGSLRVPTFATCIDGKVVAYSTHGDAAQALRMGLQQALQQCQAEQYRQPAYALAPVPDFPVHLRSEQLSVPRFAFPDAWSDRQEHLLQQLQANGLHACAVPLDHDPALARVLPCVVRVLLTGTERQKGE